MRLNDKASNRILSIEDVTDELIVVNYYYMKLAKLSSIENPLKRTHTIDSIIENNESKTQ